MVHIVHAVVYMQNMPVLTSAYIALLSRLVFTTPQFFWSFINKMAAQYGCTVYVAVLLYDSTVDIL